MNDYPLVFVRYQSQFGRIWKLIYRRKYDPHYTIKRINNMTGELISETFIKNKSDAIRCYDLLRLHHTIKSYGMDVF